MTDNFAALNEPRRPWIDAEALKAKFLARSAEIHPDRVHGAGEAEKAEANKRFAEIVAAYNCLRDPKERLGHLLELELGRRPQEVHEIAPEFAAAFMEVARLCRQVDEFLAEKRKITSPMLRAGAFERGQGWTEKLMELQGRLRRKSEAISAELERMNADWPADGMTPPRAGMLSSLEDLYRRLSYFARWSAQLQERIVQLSF